MTEWVLVLTLTWAIGHEDSDYPPNMVWLMPDHETCLTVLETSPWPRIVGNQLQYAECVERPKASEEPED